MNPIKIKKSITAGIVPLIAETEIGELAINAADGILYARKGTGIGTDTIISLNSPEIGGKAYKTGYAPGYTIGDVVVDAGIAYLCNATYAPSVDFATDIVNWTSLASAAEKGGVAWVTGRDYVIGDVVVETSVAYFCNSPHTAQASFASDSSSWTAIGTTEVGGVAWVTGTFYAVGDIITESGVAYMSIISHTASPLFSTDLAKWDAIIAPERGGILHNDAGISYLEGDTATVSGSEYIYHCITPHTSAATCVGDATNWSQPPAPGYSPTEYNYTSDISYSGKGPYIFTVDTGSAGRTAQVWIEGFELKFDEFNTATDAEVTMLGYVSDNSWVKIII